MNDTERFQKENEQLRNRLVELTQEVHRLKKLSETDGLTGLANRRSFEKVVRQRFIEQSRGGNVFCLMMIDVDEFKRINDRLGHSAGDQLLQNISAALERNLRSSDLVFRVGGDELAVILPNSEMAISVVVANRIIDTMCCALEDYRQYAAIGLSIGLVESIDHPSVEDLLDAADKAMYQAKKRGGNRCSTDSSG
ncbi:MAG: GGDEF domain-containing protein [Planctomycetaceae bacterium]|nr:GGDEF domain-containing protein [Planctomycetaceae bacterium]MCP4463877.1 GGDEF domain-containing protein [Planctomycetaceae bacterium]MDG1809156.1 GGDEF domain-containing protein [Pirellulaceae bacterium]MDG2103366.1 GGDEF domain-containing protein [Pirellulaceae bacterium]